jgi:hypothetical protein
MQWSASPASELSLYEGGFQNALPKKEGGFTTASLGCVRVLGMVRLQKANFPY